MNMIMVEDGHTSLAQALFDETFHMAWGGLPDDYPDKWTIEETPPDYVLLTETATLTKGASGGLDALPKTPVDSIVSVVAGVTTYLQGTDYALSGNAVNWELPGAEPETGVTYQVTYRYRVSLALRHALELEKGRRLVTLKTYAVEDPNGSIIANGTKWSSTDTPTRNLYLQFKFDADDAPTDIIYQLGIFMGTTPAEGVAPDKQYLLPSEIGNAGILFMAENVAPFARNPATREMFEYVITF
ncbi:MAG: DUF4815 domain-containing protein [Syntrophobacteraceae bacterium]|jgi:hypothetical protein|nr:DUF4815 domain-containing protein [Syntrophobacteraceae bacterium]